MLSSGCVALNIPSKRFHDSTDHGGVFGPWRKHHHVGDSSHADPASAHVVNEHGLMHGWDGGPLEVDPFDPSLDANGQPKKQDIPWPRFHPIPTNPVFGGR